MDTTQALRQLKIKGGILKRCMKDYGSYAKEKVLLEEKLEKIKAQEDVEEGIVRRAEEGLAETVQMLPNCKTRIMAALSEVEGLIEQNAANEELVQHEDWATANATLAEATAFVETI